MDTTVWTFLIIVVICSIIGYFLLKRYSNYYAKKKTDKIIQQFMDDNDLQTSDKSFEEVERELFMEDELLKEQRKKKKKKKKEKKKDKKKDKKQKKKEKPQA